VKDLNLLLQGYLTDTNEGLLDTDLDVA